jgi:hypothetical protein
MPNAAGRIFLSTVLRALASAGTLQGALRSFISQIRFIAEVMSRHWITDRSASGMRLSTSARFSGGGVLAIFFTILSYILYNSDKW